MLRISPKSAGPFAFWYRAFQIYEAYRVENFRVNLTQIPSLRPPAFSSSTLVSLAEIICGPPGAIKNGYYEINGGYNFNSTATYSCLGGYELNGTKVRRCQENGNWSGILPTCKSKNFVIRFIVYLHRITKFFEMYQFVSEKMRFNCV